MAELDVILAGLHTRFDTISTLKALLDHEPKSVQVAPLLYSMYLDYDRTDAGQVVAETHRFMHRVVVSWADPKVAEAQLRVLITAVPLSVELDPRLGGAIPRGIAQVSSGRAGFTRIDGSVYRIMDFTSTVVAKRAVQRV
jgi:hypothetical protein